MKRKFTVVITRKGDEYVAECAAVPDVEGRGRSKEDALEKIRAAIIKKLAPVYELFQVCFGSSC